MLTRKNVKERILWAIILLVLSIMLGVQDATAKAGLSTSWGEVILRNVAIGQSYNTRELLNLPLRVTNNGDIDLEIQAEILAPSEVSLKDDYEVIPSTSWIKLGQEYFNIGPQESAVTDVIITIPDDEKYLGKKYQFHIYTHSVGSIGFMGLGLMSRVLLNIAPVRADVTPEEISKLKANLNFSVNPPALRIHDVEIGKKYDIKKLAGKEFKIINPNEEKFTYKITSIDPKKTVIKPPEDFEICPDPSFLKISKETVQVASDEIKKIKMSLEIPDKEEYKNKKYMFVIYTEVMEQDIPVGKYNMVYITTKE
ncbi:MAG: hypothetical protein ABH868_05305 [bacterium]